MLTSRRRFLQSSALLTPLASFAQTPAKTDRSTRDIRLCHRVDARSVTDDDLHFFQQIGLEWLRLEFGARETTFDALRARFG